MEDAHIVDLYWARSETAVAETAKKYGTYCYSIAHAILTNAEDAEESVNDTWLDAWNSMPPHRPAILATFLGKITRRIAIDRWRARSAEKRGGGELALALSELTDCIPSGKTVEQEVADAELEAAINRFVLSLPLTRRRVFLCRYWYLDSIAAIAKQFGLSQSSVKVLLHRTRKALRTYLEREGTL